MTRTHPLDGLAQVVKLLDGHLLLLLLLLLPVLALIVLALVLVSVGGGRCCLAAVIFGGCFVDDSRLRRRLDRGGFVRHAYWS